MTRHRESSFNILVKAGKVMAKGNCEFSGKGGEYFLTVFVHLFLFASLTAGIYAPWAAVRLFRLKASHTLIGKMPVRFIGRGGELFVKCLLWGLLCLVTLGLYAPWAACAFLKWKALNTIVGEKPSEFNGAGADLLGLSLIHLLIFPLLTLGLYLFWGIYRICAWKEEQTRYGGEKTSFGAGVGEFIKISIASWFLNLVTLNIFSPWSICMLYRWQIHGLMVGEGEGTEHFPAVKTPRLLFILPPAFAALIVLLAFTTISEFLEKRPLGRSDKDKQTADTQRVKIPLGQKQPEATRGQESLKPASALPPKVLGIFAPPRPRDAEEAKGSALEVRLGKIDSYLQKNPSNADAFYSRGWVHQSKGELEKALADYNEAVRLNPSFGDAYFNRGVIYVQTGKYDLAAEDFSTVLKYEKTSADAFSNRGGVYLQQEKFDLAIQDFTSAIAIAPDDGDMVYNRGIALIAKGEAQKGKIDLIRAEVLGQKTASEALKRIQ